MEDHRQPRAAAQAETPLFPEQTRESLQALVGKLQPLIEGRRLDNLVDLLSLLSDLIDLLDPAMVDRLASLFEQATSVGWSVGNAVRVAKAEVLREQPPNLKDLLRLLRDADTRRGLALLLGSLRSLGRQLAAEREVAHGA
ncbi:MULTISPECIES: DUF1641 domain-containing protein [Pseudomonas aeruginosa group]|uniref:DUF1641 domain-containing protein n=3 Tax=Pseudomonas aeruginosa group TaxID=136841 RepID=A0ABD7JZ20_PSEAI|nr:MULTISPECIES: DUF1641 domain-containing protein [Pseudomonas aeruginosa group]KFF35255.1 hypothetical protein G039_0311275 [Pseudomonas aeruginosa VRFPA01]VTS60901.1 Protein of uncharacterised function (DUF1641) [Streptococcus dysgalactiae subsp. equisimilis]ABR83112.1 hypothetical protein PSPA7_2667 [Pseudomonas aeruginosa PA7]AVK04887.1 hypothetical protein CSB93_3951 [Pseudomonas paraeruginosa]AVR67694.1 DUF1641 domain-containing protein [Pseudomonas paraeruginosa]